MKIEEFLAETLKRAGADEPVVIDAWARFERRARRSRLVRLAAAGMGAAAAVAALAVVVPKLVADEPREIVNPGPSESPDPTAGWKTFIDDTRSFRVKYPPEWSAFGFEGTWEIDPPGVTPLPKGALTFAVELRTLDQVYDNEPCDGPRCPNPVREARGTINGLPYWLTEYADGGSHEIRYRFDFGARACPSDSCPAVPRTVQARVIGGTQELWDRYRQTGELIVGTMDVYENVAGPTPDPTTKPLAIPSDWQRLESKEAGIAFAFPPLPGNVEAYFRPGSDSGTTFGWEIARSDVEPAYTYSFAGGVSKDFGEGREGWVTDVYRWAREGTSFLLEPYRFKINPIKVVPRDDRLLAVIFDPDGLGSNPGVAKAAVLNFPDGYDGRFGAVAFYFHDPTSIEMIETVIRSVTFTRQAS